MEFLTSPGPISYPEALSAMEERVNGILAGKAQELLWFLEHPSLYTAGTSAKSTDLLDTKRFPVYQTGRGGQHTYHGPGQRVAYAILNLKKRQKEPDLRQYVKSLEQWIINTLRRFEIIGETRDGRIGIWVKHGGTESKIAAVGIRVRQWVAYHGIALNVNPNLAHFAGIVPCGIRDYGVTSLHALGHPLTMEEVDQVLKEEFDKLFA